MAQGGLAEQGTGQGLSPCIARFCSGFLMADLGLTYALEYFSIPMTYRLKYYCIAVGIYSVNVAAARPAA